MGALLRAAGLCLGMNALSRLRLRRWLGRRVHGAIARARSAAGSAPRRSPQGALVLLYHRLSADGPGWRPTGPLSVPVDLFRAQMEALFSRFEVVPVDRLLEAPPAGARPRAAVTFDDGYRDNLELAHPVLEDLQLPAAVFVATRWLGGRGRFWWYELEDLARRGALGRAGRGARWAAFAAEASRLKALPEGERAARLEELRARAAPARERGDPLWAPLMLSAGDLRFLEASGLWTVGGHTHTHPILARLPLQEAEAEIAENRRVLEEALGHPPRWFAYPNGDEGDFGPEHVDLLRRAGYAGAFTGISPFPERSGGGPLDPFRIPRLAVSGLEALAEFKNHLAGVFWPR
jgi:peptidoglycan/xylan/chitin deacetylase (PgdA/CDA1 family)